MNILSHFYLDRNHPSAYYQLGTLIPDLVKNFNQKIRKDVFKNQDLIEPEYKALLLGIKKHYEVDALFHQLPFFHRFSTLIKNRLLEQAPPAFHYRAYFLAHIALEMMLDRTLIKQYPGLPVEIYDKLETINPSTVTTYFDTIGREDFQSEFFGIFRSFIKGAFLLHYADNEKFIKALLRVYKFIHPGEFKAYEVRAKKKILQEIEGSYHHEFLVVFETVKEALAPPKSVISK